MNPAGGQELTKSRIDSSDSIPNHQNPQAARNMFCLDFLENRAEEEGFELSSIAARVRETVAASTVAARPRFHQQLECRS